MPLTLPDPRRFRGLGERGEFCRRADRSSENIAASRHGANDLLCVVSQSAPYLANALHDGVVGDSRIGPNGVDDLFLRDHPATVLNQIDESLEGLRSKRNLLSGSAQKALLHVERESREHILLV
jgi:hypothetical protein